MENLPSQLYDLFSPEPGPAAEFLVWLKETYGLGDEIDLLDIGCGPGQSLREYARLRWRVVGMEPNEVFYIQAAAVAEELEGIEVRSGGFNDIEDVARFHLITAINGPFAYLLEPHAQLDALERIYQALKPGGVLFLDIPNLLWFLKNELEPPKERKTLDGREIRLREQYHYDLHDAIFTQVNEYLVTEPGGGEIKFSETHKHTILTFPELAYRLGLCGFVEVRTYNGFESCQVERLTGKRMLVSAQKPADF
jgi:SAM-dependent methyltransferase